MNLPVYLIFGQPIITTGQQLNALLSTVPFLTIAPDSRSGGIGDAGAATSPDINSQHWNPAKYAYIESMQGVAVSYTPWLRNLISDINLAYLAGFYRIDNKQVVSTSLRYFSFGRIYNPAQGFYHAYEYAVDIAYSRLVTGHLSAAIACRYIYSDNTGGYLTGGTEVKPGTAMAGDMAFYYQNNLSMGNKDSRLAFGLNISNIGTRMAYTEIQEKAFIPINLRFGGALTMVLNDNNSVSIAMDVNKLLVPSPPIYKMDSLGNSVLDDDGNRIIEFGKDPDVSVPLGMIRSFWDAPGFVKENGDRSVLLEELHEIMYSFGAEYRYKNRFAIRGGYYHEHETKGNRKFFTFGAGFRFYVFGLDCSYIIPVKVNSPLAKTIRFTLSFEFQKQKDYH